MDLLNRTLDLLGDERVKEVLAERLRLVVVDEFQDTSPVQLALFVLLHQVANRSVWVGDRKQCIFEYAGADPRLMDDVTRWVARTGGTQDQLENNWRSRPELVDFLLGAVRGRSRAARLRARGGRRVGEARGAPGARATPAARPVDVHEVRRRCTGLCGRHRAHARDLRRQRWCSTERRTRCARVRAGDIAVLVATNREATSLAQALHERGIRAAVARPGLLATPEGVLVDAALRWLLDRGDTLAAARLDALHAFDGTDADAWLDGLLGAANAERVSEVANRAVPRA